MITAGDLKKTQGTEITVIILCCRVFFKTATNNDLQEFISRNEINWNTFRTLARIHRLRPMVYQVVHKQAIPDEFKAGMKAELGAITVENWKLAMETERLILLFAKHGVDAIPYKGMAFSRQFFGDLTSRESSDIDLIIDPQRLDKAVQLLTADGYMPELEDIRQYLGERYCSYYKDYNLNKFDNGHRLFHIELHWRIAESYIGLPVKIDALFAQTNNQITGVKADLKALDDVAHLSALIIHHALKDNFKYLKNVADLAQAFNQPHIQERAGAIRSEFAGLQLSKALALGNVLSKRLMGVSLFKTTDVAVDEPFIDYFLKQTCSGKLLNLTDAKGMEQEVKNTALLQDNLVNKIKFYAVCLKHRFIPGQLDFRLLKLPRALFFLYYLFKPFRSAIKPYNARLEKQKLIPVN